MTGSVANVWFGSQEDPLVLDGGLASQLEDQGHDLSGALWSARLLAENPGAVRRAHEAYYAAGADVGISASYQASREGFGLHGHSSQEADRLLRLSVELVREAREAVGGARALQVAASVGPYGAIRHDGSEYRGRYGVPHEDLVAFHRERLLVLMEAGPDVLAIETIPDLDEALAVIEALDGVDGDVPAWLSFSCADGRTTNAGQPIEAAADLVAEAARIGAIGVNCTAPEHVTELLTRIHATRPELPVVVYPNSGRTWDPTTSRWRGAGSHTIPPEVLQEWSDAGATALGGCCGLGPSAIGAMAAFCRATG